MFKSRLFDEVEWYQGHALDTESAFHFLNRADGQLWQLTRDVLEEWYGDYSDPDGDLRARFRSDDIRQHLAAWWELYVYTMFRQLGYDVEVHPTVANTERRPDFRVSRASSGVYVECAAIAGDDAVENPAGQAWICECINRARNPDFMVEVDITGVGTDQPTVAEIVSPIEEWLAKLDYDLMSEVFDASMDAAEEIFEFRDWEVRIVALPVNEEIRGRDGRLIAIYPMNGARTLDEQGKIRAVLRKKGSRYGALDEPLIVALLSWSSFTDAREMTNAAFGSLAVTYFEHDLASGKLVRQRDGYWRPPPSARGSRIAAVLFAEAELKPWTVDKTLPELWLNPWAPTPVTAALPFATHTADNNGSIISMPATSAPQNLLNLAPEWSRSEDA
jgi:hypothetical protein